MKTLMITSEKGGTGKTTLATHIAGGLALRGKRVLLVDFDPQGHATLSFGLEKSPALYDLLVRDAHISDSVRVPDPSTFVPAGLMLLGKLYVLPGNEETHSIPTSSRMQRTAVFAEALEDLNDMIDVCIIDTAPSPGLLLTLVYRASDYVLIPAQMEYLPLNGLMNTVRAMNEWQLKLMGIVPTMYRESTDLHKHHLEQLKEAAQANQWNVWSPIKQRVSWAEASTYRQMVYVSGGAVGKAKAEAYKLVEQVERSLAYA